MKRALALAWLAGAVAAAAQTSPDPSKVTTVGEAAKLCGLTEAGIRWSAAEPDRIKIVVADPSELPKLAEGGALKTCFFPWAYERKVTVEFGLAEAGGK